MGEPRIHYDEEFKSNAVELNYRNGKTIGQVAWRPAFPGMGKLRRRTDLEGRTALRKSWRCPGPNTNDITVDTMAD